MWGLGQNDGILIALMVIMQLMTQIGAITPAPSPTPTVSPAIAKTTDYLANERTYLAWIRTALGRFIPHLPLVVMNHRLGLTSQFPATAVMGVGFAAAKFATSGNTSVVLR